MDDQYLSSIFNTRKVLRIFSHEFFCIGCEQWIHTDKAVKIDNDSLYGCCKLCDEAGY